MYHELPHGEVLIFKVDLTAMSEERFNAVSNAVNRLAYMVQQVPGKQVLKVYWNLEASLASALNLSHGLVSPWPDSM